MNICHSSYSHLIFLSGVLVDLHSDFPEDSATGCGHINMEAVQQVLAAKWAIDVINNQSLPHELNIGTVHSARSEHHSNDKIVTSYIHNAQVFRSTIHVAIRILDRNSCSS